MLIASDERAGRRFVERKGLKKRPTASERSAVCSGHAG